jgi:hypothetical protein
MRKTLLLFFLLVVLAAPAMAAPRNGDPGGGQGFISRIMRLIRALDDIVAGPPHP